MFYKTQTVHGHSYMKFQMFFLNYSFLMYLSFSCHNSWQEWCIEVMEMSYCSSDSTYFNGIINSVLIKFARSAFFSDSGSHIMATCMDYSPSSHLHFSLLAHGNNRHPISYSFSYQYEILISVTIVIDGHEWKLHFELLVCFFQNSLPWIIDL